ncbi:MAG: FHA domain-containing protein [Myxococcaceae bacterium]|nr:MAG: FHA domain-containing protein [Myxococcaceae bacterium]
MPELVFLRRGEEVLRFSLERPRVVLGRGERCDVVIPDPEVSRQQAAVVLSGDTASVEDLSGKGTVVGGTRAPRAQLTDGTEIALGQWRAIFRAHATSGDEAPETEVRGTVAQPRADGGSDRWQAAQIRLRHAGTESVHRLVGEGATIGKDSGNDLVLDDRFISAKHLRITRRGNRFLVLDHASTNGTWFGAVRLFEAEVPLHTQLHIGETDVLVEPATAARKDAPASWQGLVGADPAMKLLIELIERVAPSSAAVTILGESGTGKELVARAIHARSSRAERPFVPVNCAAISKELIESELFGHEKGAFTGAVGAHKGAFEEADGGTLFLDEIGELPLELQPKLLRALESGEIKRVGSSRPGHVDVRVVAATNRDLLAASRTGQFRDDLYYRLYVVPLTLPPLRTRRGDIPALAQYLLSQFSPRGQTVRFTPAALARLESHPWPGNVRELRNVVHRALLLRRGSAIDEADLTFDPDPSPRLRDARDVAGQYIPGRKLEELLELAERQIVESALRQFNNNRERVARELGVARSTLFKRLKDWGMTRQDDPEQPQEQA